MPAQIFPVHHGIVHRHVPPYSRKRPLNGFPHSVSPNIPAILKEYSFRRKPSTSICLPVHEQIIPMLRLHAAKLLHYGSASSIPEHPSERRSPEPSCPYHGTSLALPRGYPSCADSGNTRWRSVPSWNRQCVPPAARHSARKGTSPNSAPHSFNVGTFLQGGFPG